MALNLSQKQVVVAELTEVASKAHSLVAAEYAGLTVGQLTAMRKKARETGVYLRVVKNTLASRAVAGPTTRRQDALSVRCHAFSTKSLPPGV
jgi:large subunit ribosomal protein L10